VNSYRLTEGAEAEILEIFLYGIDQFGVGQARLYKDEMAHCFQLLADTPRMGRPANIIAEGVRRHEHKSHVILYEIESSGVLILAVVHGRSVRRLKL
jgi:toxin ParE1/3/4